MSKVIYEKGTQGTETSYVPEGRERKQSIPRVVASEIGRAQTRSSNTSGVRTTINHQQF